MTTIQTAAQFGRADRNLVFLQAAATGSTILAILIGAVIVGNTMLLSLFERTREFGLLRAIGWTRSRVVSLVVGEGVVLAVVGAIAGVALSFAATAALESSPAAPRRAARELHEPGLLAGPLHRARDGHHRRALSRAPCRQPGAAQGVES